ncbi:MAG: acyl-CoA dehydrogenase [Acidimicrobiales bacterium]|nr:acyl-CoA dehydrogenase [Acidimicrobiales bacterium]MXX41885.1 acyl-CoA dehydrogenase [Acidimicrobiales bacterium]MYB80271.1 acyl-CoA dehydrogenase [Acidimicrobiales bacterium]MYG60317.1 acyl-CoA dehydrogenase [Acidimicrobiales bacterium]MYI09387.1 acyl-CoA dehydrogenase [Acidimicrobiales bacterium]
MSEYSAPVDDMLFVLEHIAELDGLAAHEQFAHADLETAGALLDEAGRFMSSEVAPLNVPGDQQGLGFDEGVITHPDGFGEAYRKFVGAGWNGMAFDPDFGGGGMPWCVGLAVQEMLTSASMAFSLCPLLTQGAIDALLHHADETLQQTYLPKMISGEWSGTMNLTEPHAGSDVGALTSRAEPRPDGSYLITGTKIFITYGEHELADNIIHLVLARTPDSPPGTRGISLFLVPKFLVNPDGSLGERNDLRAVSTEHKIGIHASPTCVMSYGDNGGAVGYMVGPEHGGMRAMFTMMNNARLSVGLQGLSLTERAYQQARDYAVERKQGRAIGTELPPGQSSPIVDHADVRRMLMTMRANAEAMRCVMYLNAAAIDESLSAADPDERAQADELVALLTPISKGWGTDLGVEMTSLGVQVHGGMGYVEETGAAQHWRDSRIAPIYEGTNGIQAADLAFRKLPLDGGKAMARLIGQIGETAAELAASDDADLKAISASLSAGAEAFGNAAMWLGTQLASAPNDVAAGSTPFMRLAGVVVGGWLLARSAQAAANLLAEQGLSVAEARDAGGSGPSGPQFLADKIATAHFYATQILSGAAGLVPAVTGGADQFYAIPADRL